MKPGRVPTFREFSDPFNLDNGVVSCVEVARSSKRSNKETHARATRSPSVNLMRGGKTGGGDDA